MSGNTSATPGTTTSRRLGLIVAGLGKIARDQHLPALAGCTAVDLVATADPQAAGVAGIPHHSSLSAALAAHPGADAVAVCTPPQYRHAVAAEAIAAGRHVLLEKPPAATLTEMDDLVARADAAGVSLFATWHSRFAPAVAPAADWLAGRRIRRIAVTWKENVRRWHPGQAWIWQPGGIGVFDTGINALSILTALLPGRLHLRAADLDVPGNCAMPVAVRLRFADIDGAEVIADFDWLLPDPPVWEIAIDTDDGRLVMSGGGRRLMAGDRLLVDAPDGEYAAIYDHFAALIAAGRSDVDASPFRLVADAFMIGRQRQVAAFSDP